MYFEVGKVNFEICFLNWKRSENNRCVTLILLHFIWDLRVWVKRSCILSCAFHCDWTETCLVQAINHLCLFSPLIWEEMENLDVKTLFLAVHWEAGRVDPKPLSGSYAMPEESSGRFGLKSSKMEAVSRSPVLPWVAFADLWSRRNLWNTRISWWWRWRSRRVDSYPRCVGKSFTSLQRTNTSGMEDCNWKETLEDGRVLYELTNCLDLKMYFRPNYKKGCES